MDIEARCHRPQCLSAQLKTTRPRQAPGHPRLPVHLPVPSLGLRFYRAGVEPCGASQARELGATHSSNKVRIDFLLSYLVAILHRAGERAAFRVIGVVGPCKRAEQSQKA